MCIPIFSQSNMHIIYSAKSIAEKSGNDSLKALAYFDMGDLYLQWDNYKQALATKMSDSIVKGLANGLKQLAMLLHQPQNKPMIKVHT